MTHVPKIKSLEQKQREQAEREQRERKQIERLDEVFWVCMGCNSRMKRGFMIPDWVFGDTAEVRCPLCMSTDCREDGREPLMARRHRVRKP